MSVRVKTLAVVAGVLLGLGMLVLLTVARAGHGAALNADQQDAQARAGRLRSALAQQLDDLHRQNRDYANWDDMHAYCAEPNEAFVQTNLDPKTLHHQRFAQVLLTKPDGQPIVALGVDRSGQPAAADSALRRLLLDDARLRDLSLRAGGVQCVRGLTGRSVLLSACAVLTSGRRGPVTGIMVVARPLDRQQMHTIAQSSGVDGEPLGPDDPRLPAAVPARITARPTDPSAILAVEPDRLVGYLPLPDEQGRPAAVIRFVAPRQAYARYRAETASLALVMALLTLVAAAVCVALLDRLVLGRLSRLTGFVGAIDLAQPSSDRASLEGARDELHEMAAAINGLLDRAADHHERSRRAEARVMALANSAQSLLAGPDQDPFQQFVEALGPASGADRVRIFTNYTDDAGELRADPVAEWCAPGIEPQRARLCGVPYRGHITRWPELLLREGLVHCRVSDLLAEERAMVEPQGIQALLVLPVLLDTEFVGMVGFDNCHSDALFEPADEAFLRSAVASLTQAMRQQRAVAALAESEASYRLVTDNVIDVIWAADLDGRFTFVSPSIETMRGYRPDEIIGRTMLDAVTPASLPLVAEALRATLDEVAEGRLPEPRSLELEQPCKDGSTVWTESHAKVMTNSEGQAIGFIGVTHDITEQRAAQHEREVMTNRLRQAAKMEAIGQLAGGVAHDFNNVLTTITGYCDLLRLSLPSTSPMVHDVDEILSAANRAAELTRQLLAFSRKESGKTRVVDLNNVVRGMERMLRRLVPENTAIVSSLDPRPALVNADPGQIEQIIMNLVVNSGHAMPEGGAITIETALVDLHETSFENEFDPVSGPHVTLTVRDEGHGMDEATRQRIFEPFFTTKPAGVGTGLGLAMVYGMARQNDGHVLCDSAPGAGTVFSLYLPRANTPATSGEPTRSQLDDLGGDETILVVEDEVSVRMITQRVLANLGYTVLLAENAREALALVANGDQTIDLLLTDVVMPEMSGGELAALVQQQRPDLPVLFISGYADSVIASLGALGHGAELLPKPFTAAELASSVRKVLEKAGGGAA